MIRFCKNEQELFGLPDGAKHGSMEHDCMKQRCVWIQNVMPLSYQILHGLYREDSYLGKTLYYNHILLFFIDK